MSDDQAKRTSDADKELEREIRKERKFTVAEAIGRMAGPGAMKGVSPVPPQRAAELEIKEYLSQHLVDSAGVLADVLRRQVNASELLLNNVDQPLVALASYVHRVLDSEYLQEELIRQADVEWARVFDERPHFAKEGCAPHPDDPYTTELVRTSLLKLIESLKTVET